MGAKLLMIALDGADSRLLQRLAESGELPEIADLARQGKFTFLRNDGEFTDDSAWASFCYASPASVHKRYHYEHKTPSGSHQMAYLDEDGRHTFWSRLSDKNHQIAVIDIPKCPAPVALNGIHIADWLVHGKYHPHPVSHPAGLADQTIRRFGASPPSRCGYYQENMTPGAARSFVDHLDGTVSQKLACGLHHLGDRDWDLFMIGFKEAHCAGHALWHLHDPHHPLYDAQVARRAGDPLLDVYAALDKAVGQLAKAAGDNANILVFTTFDMVPNGSVWHLRDAIETRLNAALRSTLAQSRSRFGNWFASISRRPVESFCEVVPANDNLLALRIMAHDRIPQDWICAEIERLLSDLREPGTGQAAFESIQVLRDNDMHSRHYGQPDIVATCTPGRFPSSLTSLSMAGISAPAPSMRTGNYATGGALIAVGQSAVRHAADCANLCELGPAAEAILNSLKAPRPPQP